MQRSDYAFHALASDQYEAIVTAAEMDGRTSPMHGETNYNGLMRESRAFDIDPRLSLAWTLWEDHDGTDPGGGIELAKVFNFGGIKWAQQPYAFDSRIPCPPSEGGTYAGFADFGAFVHGLYLTLTNNFCGPSFESGDLANAASMYITGRLNSGVGQERVDTLRHYQAAFPSEHPNDGPQGVYGEDLVNLVRSMIGQANSAPGFDRLNGVHPWAGFSEALAESAPRALGLAEVPRPTALAKLQAARAQGLIRTNAPAEHGAWVFFDEGFNPKGYVGFWDADQGEVLGTVENGRGIDYRAIGPGTSGYAGWCRVPGVVGPRR